MNKINKKISEATDTAFSKELLDETITPVETDTTAIKKQTFEKLGIDYATSSANKRPHKKNISLAVTPAGKKKKRGALSIIGIAAAIAVVFSTSVYAATVIYRMSQQKVDYFEPSSAIQTPVDKPTYHQNLGVDVEQFNSPVGITVEAAEKAITLDSVSVDDNFINAFFTIVYDEPLDLTALYDINYPAYSILSRYTPFFTIKTDGQDLDYGFSTTDGYDPYMTDDKTIKMMVRSIIPTSLPDVFSLSLDADDSLRSWLYETEYVEHDPLPSIHFEINVDKSASAAYTKSITPGVYELGDQKLDLNRFTISPFGCAITINEHALPPTGDIVYMPDPDYLSVSSLYMTDDKGNVLRMINNINSFSLESSFYSNEIMGADLGTESITITPVLFDEDNASGEDRTYSVNDIGQKIELNSFSGYTLEDYVVEGSRISFVLKPYGIPPHTDFIPNDEGLITLDNGQSGLINETIDRKTGITTYSIDYYAATPEELASITTFTVYYSDGYFLDTDNSITLPLQSKP